MSRRKNTKSRGKGRARRDARRARQGSRVRCTAAVLGAVALVIAVPAAGLLLGGSAEAGFIITLT